MRPPQWPPELKVSCTSHNGAALGRAWGPATSWGGGFPIDPITQPLAHHLRPLDNIANTAINNTQAYFTLGLRDAVMQAILRQDREYFDFHHAGVLQER